MKAQWIFARELEESLKQAQRVSPARRRACLAAMDHLVRATPSAQRGTAGANVPLSHGQFIADLYDPKGVRHVEFEALLSQHWPEQEVRVLTNRRRAYWLDCCSTLEKRALAIEAHELKSQRQLTPQQLAQVRAEMVPEGAPVRFVVFGRIVDIRTGERQAENTPRSYQRSYGHFTPKTARKIALWLGASCMFEQPQPSADASAAAPVLATP